MVGGRTSDSDVLRGAESFGLYSPVATFSFIIHTLSLLGGSAKMQ